MKIIISGGGTGGHIYPALTIMRTIEEKYPDTSFLYVGTHKGLEADIIPKENIPFATVDIQGFKRSLSPANFVRAGLAAVGVAKAMNVVRKFKPDAVIGTGGYVCGPVLMAASMLGIPTLIQEQNVVPGITNKILAKFVTRIAAGTPEAEKHFPAGKVICTGNPIRKAVLTATREEGAKAFGFDPAKKTVLISGGSRGARSINNAMVDVLVEAAKQREVQYLHVTGKLDYEDIIGHLAEKGVNLAETPNIKVEPYLYNMPQAMAMADLVVYRAGATGLAELTARGIPAILIPYPYAAENHQEHNARALEAAGAAKVILNRELKSDILQSTLQELLADDAKLASMAAASKSLGKPQAAEDIAQMVIDMTQGRKTK
ncbi:undecaprenyldiphospho-muramoylpentapeptide beta-N-acetylglucosaminyltransferase [Selenomonas ruminantium]|uniref:UDP-N-acetylglucosamine--N-acetylmuramyl-(pentapeptide) pyrophosphoryl-undecaprenol N-acetylglucosamine transferase n=1 Tax=Selenomonas ruminantium TaxID=971 RepID=A0A1I0W3H0_SELRU|nr:undecaprenyldiphospho-muramoylpentapeptide beta-N-acetylglucosaminyltransferase [Selenomonas ruminantium]SFA82790.1 UDP-N-acetylglucosamine-N-acetylmuramylpentapeptide N-acetylglucosamine transferase [Selenomonas ruminantium]